MYCGQLIPTSCHFREDKNMNRSKGLCCTYFAGGQVGGGILVCGWYRRRLRCYQLIFRHCQYNSLLRLFFSAISYVHDLYFRQQSSSTTTRRRSRHQDNQYVGQITVNSGLGTNDLEIQLRVTRGHWRCHHSIDHNTTYYQSAIVSLALSCSITEVI